MRKIIILLVCTLGLVSLTRTQDGDFAAEEDIFTNEDLSGDTAIASDFSVNRGRDRNFCNFFFTTKGRKPQSFFDSVSSSRPTSNNKSLQDEHADDNIDTIDYSGTACQKVVLTLWSGANFRQGSTIFTLRRNQGRLELDDFWTDNVSSYQITLKS